jgi:glycerophosphoryl diester phosphodiesterase
MRRRSLIVTVAAIVIIVSFASFQYFYPGDREGLGPARRLEVLAHRGVHAQWKKGTYDTATGCEATHIDYPTHGYIENTLESIGAAFGYGATIVEIDIRRTGDDHLVVFHDDRLECRTNGRGSVRDHDLAYLKTLDVGYGYTPDGGRTYPFRGKGIGKMPTLVEVLRAYPERKFLIDDKDGSSETALIFARTLEPMSPDRRKMLSYWGTTRTYAVVHERIPEVTRLFLSRAEIKRCLLPYMLTFGIADFPEEYAGRAIGMDLGHAKFLWGWPYRFIEKAKKNNNDVYIVVDTISELKAISDIPVDGVITDRIEVIGRRLRR